ncbi:unnamed protein product, partial [Polarella glacialis]
MGQENEEEPSPLKEAPAPMVQELVRLLEERGLPGPTQLSSAECAEDFAVRLLAARRDSLEKALALATSDEDWRRDLNLSSYASKHDPREILGGVDPAVLQSIFPHFTQGQDREGRPVVYKTFGAALVISELVKSVSISDCAVVLVVVVVVAVVAVAVVVVAVAVVVV